MSDCLANDQSLPDARLQRSQAMPVDLGDEEHAEDDARYDRFTNARKAFLVAVLSLGGFNASMDTMAVNAVIPEIAAEYETTGTVIGISNAVYVLIMAFSPAFWGPLSQIYGRRWVGIISTTLFTAFSVGSAASPSLVTYFIFRGLTAFETTAFYLLGSACVGDMYRPEERGTALGWFLLSTVVSPAFGPFIAGVIVTYRSWRVLFWLQAALGVAAMGLLIIFMPETAHHLLKDDMPGMTEKKKLTKVCHWLNPMRTIRLLRYPKLLVVYLASSALIWNQQCLLTPIRYIINPRFKLTSPLLSGLFFLAPGLGYIVGTIGGGRWADVTVKRAMKRRGRRVAEDRLQSSLLPLGVIGPASVLIYGWTIDKEVGGIPVPVISMFLQGVAHMMCFPCLNAYCLDVLPDSSTEAIAGAYFTRYIIGAIGTAGVLPAIQEIGLGWFSTLSAFLLALSTALVYMIIPKYR